MRNLYKLSLVQTFGMLAIVGAGGLAILGLLLWAGHTLRQLLN